MKFCVGDLVAEEEVRPGISCVFRERLVESLSVDHQRVHVVSADGERGVRRRVDVCTVDPVLDNLWWCGGEEIKDAFGDKASAVQRLAYGWVFFVDRSVYLFFR